MPHVMNAYSARGAFTEIGNKPARGRPQMRIERAVIDRADRLRKGQTEMPSRPITSSPRHSRNAGSDPEGHRSTKANARLPPLAPLPRPPFNDDGSKGKHVPASAGIEDSSQISFRAGCGKTATAETRGHLSLFRVPIAGSSVPLEHDRFGLNQNRSPGLLF